MLDIPSLQEELARRNLDGWLLYDFKGQNPTAQTALGVHGHMVTRRWFYLVPRTGAPTLLLHAIEKDNLPPLPGERQTYAGHEQLGARLKALLSGRARVAMEYCPLGAIPYLSRVDAGTVELVRSFGPEVVSSADLVQLQLCRWDDVALKSHERASAGVYAAVQRAFKFVRDEHAAGRAPLETVVMDQILAEYAARGMITDHPPIVAVNAHAGNPHFVTGSGGPTPVKRGDLLLLDVWAKENDPRHAYADITWMGVVDDAVRNPRHEEVFRVVADGRDAALELIRREHSMGRRVKGFEADRAARDLIASRGYGEKFVHRTGHNIGCDADHGDGAHLDDFETHDTRELMPRTCFSIEPGVYLEDFGVRSEIDVYLAEDGPKVFTPIQHDLVRVLG